MGRNTVHRLLLVCLWVVIWLKKYCDIWFDDIGHVCGHLNSWIPNHMQKVNKYFVRILSPWIALPQKYMELIVQQI